MEYIDLPKTIKALNLAIADEPLDEDDIAHLTLLVEMFVDVLGQLGSQEH